MWLFTKLGFYSVVLARFNEGRGSPDPTRLMVRARSIPHLKALQEAFPDEFPDPVHTSAGSDYPARLFIDKAVFVERVMPRLSAMIDYDNFKGALTRTKQHEYHDACSRVWSVMHAIQAPRKRYLPERDHQGSFHWSDDADRLRGSRVPVGSSMPRSPWSFDEEDQPTQRQVRRGRATCIPQPTDVVVVSEWSSSARLFEPVCVLTDVGHYKRSRVAVRDAAALGWIRPVRRKNMMLDRMTPEAAGTRYPDLKRVSMRDVTPTKWFQVGTPGVAHTAAPPPEVRPKENPVSEQPAKRVIESSVRASANPAKAAFGGRPAPLVEDTSVVGGVDEETGAPVIRPRTPDGRADESTRATDPQEGHS